MHHQQVMNDQAGSGSYAGGSAFTLRMFLWSRPVGR
jgi:hypothetical protein